MEAVQWLRDQGILSHSTKHLPKTSTMPASSRGLSPPREEFSPTLQEQDDTDGAASTDSIAKQVHALSLRLGFTQPAFVMEQSDKTTAMPFWDVHAKFNARDVQYEPKLVGKIGETFRVFGKKAAKEECSRNVLAVLLEIERHWLR